MDRIYSNASRVLVWLGPDHELLNPFLWACTTFKIRHEKMTRDGRFPPTVADSRFWDAAGVPNAWDRFRAAVLFSALCRWFTGIWVIQEAILASQITFICGTVQIPWDGIHWLGREFSTSTPLAPDSILPDGLEWAHSIGHRAWQIQRRRGKSARPSTQYQAALNDTSRFLELLLDMIETFRTTECFDDRDKVYAILGVSRSKLDIPESIISTLVTVDYKNLSWQDVYYQLAKAAVENMESLLILHHVQNISLDDKPSLPSWVPDFSWSMNVTPIHHRAPIADPFSIWANKSLLVGSPGVLDTELSLFGVKIDVVCAGCPSDPGPLPILAWLELCAPAKSRVASCTRIDSLVSATIMRNILRVLPDLKTETARKAFKKFAQFQLGTALWRAQLAHETDHDTLVDSLANALHPFQDEIVQDQLPSLGMILQVKVYNAVVENEGSSELLKTAANARLFELEIAGAPFAKSMEQMRALFRTTRGTLGTGPLTLEPDDEIWAIARADTPFVLRPFETDSKPKKFRLVGDCYLHEYMHGELVKEDPDIIKKLEPIVLV